MATTTTEALTPREAEALAAFDALPDQDRSYAAVAQALGVTEGRAGVYVRDALRKSGRTDTPKRGRKGNGSSTRTVATPTVDAMLEQQISTIASAIERMEAQITEATADAEEFDAEAWIAAETQRLDAQAKEARARATAFAKNEGNVATEAAEQQRTALDHRMTAVLDANEEALAQAREQLAKAQQLAEMAASLTA